MGKSISAITGRVGFHLLSPLGSPQLDSTVLNPYLVTLRQSALNTRSRCRKSCCALGVRKQLLRRVHCAGTGSRFSRSAPPPLRNGGPGIRVDPEPKCTVGSSGAISSAELKCPRASESRPNCNSSIAMFFRAAINRGSRLRTCRNCSIASSCLPAPDSAIPNRFRVRKSAGARATASWRIAIASAGFPPRIRSSACFRTAGGVCPGSGIVPTNPTSTIQTSRRPMQVGNSTGVGRAQDLGTLRVLVQAISTPH